MTDYRHDIEKYLKGELAPAERNALERKALHDPFLADALEGAEQLPATAFVKDVVALNEKIAAKKTVSVWMWSARIAAGLVILLVSSYIIWTVMNPEPVQDLAFEKSEPEVAPSTASDSVNPAPGELSSPPAEQPSADLVVRDKDITASSAKPSKKEVKSQQAAAAESEIKKEPVPDYIAATEADVKEKVDETKITESVTAAKPIENEEVPSKARAEDDRERKLALKSADKKKSVPAGSEDAGAESRDAGFTYSLPANVIRGQVTSAEDGSPLPGERNT
jgi:hypothetical protein